MNNSSKLFEFLYKDQTLKLRVDSFILLIMQINIVVLILKN